MNKSFSFSGAQKMEKKKLIAKEENLHPYSLFFFWLHHVPQIY